MNVNELKGKITARGLTIQAFCDQFGFVRSTFDRKLNGPSEFDRDEIERIINALNLTRDEARNIFFADNVTSTRNKKGGRHMANGYSSYYVKDLIPIINKTAIDLMMQPQKLFLGDQAQKVESLSQLNDRVAQFNEGVRSLAIVLTNTLEKDGEDDA